MTLKITGVNANDDLVVSEAIAFAIEGMSRLPSAHRPAGKIVDLKNILSVMPLAECSGGSRQMRAAASIHCSVCLAINRDSVGSSSSGGFYADLQARLRKPLSRTVVV